ncbi:hypothetical protein Micbo1qcDRAFT_216327 [Microdochium bolleyi]|uniref:Kelch repeat protein n=1 Tax=Microdochium bolleyi TaxID=196109 RepID=A0A136IQW8_9PEZI|nr:hypothetical protein Micbo1qcDRAFT_216327 [Microdochium bolleyi]
MRITWAVALAQVVLAASHVLDGDLDFPDAPPLLPGSAESRQVGTPAADDFIRRLHPSITRLGNHLYVHGGSISRKFNGTYQVTTSNSTLAIPLDTAWTNQTLRMREIQHGILPTVNRPILWADPSRDALYLYGGDPVAPDPAYAKTQQYYKLITTDSTLSWSIAEPADAFKFSQLYQPARTGFTVCNGVGYSLGGYATSNTDARFAEPKDQIPLPGLVTYNFATRVWTNESIFDAFSTGGSVVGGGLRDHYPTGGEALCLPDVGKAGVVMFMGGRGYSANGQTPVPMPLTDVLFYDIAGKKFHWQMTAAADGPEGGVPRDRRDGCAAMAKGKNGTYEVFVLGGFPVSGGSYHGLGDMWVLTIPGFKWLRLSGADLPQGREYTSCTSTGRHLFMVGGVSEAGKGGWNVESTDPWTQGVGVFDMADLRWRDSYSPNTADYDSPLVVQDWYRGGGVATWNEGGMEAFFTAPLPSPVPGGPNPGSSSLGGDASSNSLSKGTMIGVAVGCSIAGLIIIGLLTWFCLDRQRNKRSRSGMNSNQDVPGYKPELPVGQMQPSWSSNQRQYQQLQQWTEMDSQREPAELKPEYLPYELSGQSMATKKATSTR